MKKIKNLTLICLTFLLCVASCDNEEGLIKKEENSPLDLMTESNSEVPEPQETPEYPEEYWYGLGAFTENVMNNNPVETMEADKAMNYSESALDWRFTGHEDVSVETMETDISTFEIDYFEESGQKLIAAENISAFNNAVYDYVSSKASSLEGDILVRSIDLNWSPNEASNKLIVNVNTLLVVVVINPCPTFVTAQKDVNVSCKYNIPTTSGIRQIDNYLSKLNKCFFWPTTLCPTSTHQLANIRTVSYRLPIIAPGGPVFGHVPVTGPGGCYVAPADYNSKINDIKNIYYNMTNTKPVVLLAVSAEIVREPAPFGHRGTEWARFRIADCVKKCNLLQNPTPCPGVSARPKPMF